MAVKALPSPEVLRQLLTYDPETGKLFWLPRTPEMFPAAKFGSQTQARTWNQRFAGREAFTSINTRGHKAGMIFGTAYLAHRLIWVLQTGRKPAAEIDHVNGIPSDNRWRNLREATRKQNCANRGSRKGSTSKFLGVSATRNGAWMAQIKPTEGKGFRIGVYQTEVEAAMAYNAAATQIHGEFARLNTVT